MVIIGITGTIGAGKGTIVDYLVKEKEFTHYSVRGFLIKKLKEKGLEINRDTMTELANRLRKEHAPSYIMEELYIQAQEKGQDCIIESIRAIGEVEALKNKGNFILLAIDADKKIRYDRIKIRNSSTDNISYETFISNEEREMESNDPNKQNLKKCIEMADYTFQNNGSIDALYKDIEIMLNKKP